MKKCLTKQLLFNEVSACLVEKPECSHAQQFGFSLVCRHPEHSSFHAHVVGAMTQDEAIERYNALKEIRRNEFVAGLNEENRKYFCHKADFNGQPLAADSV